MPRARGAPKAARSAEVPHVEADDCRAPCAREEGRCAVEEAADVKDARPARLGKSYAIAVPALGTLPT